MNALNGKYIIFLGILVFVTGVSVYFSHQQSSSLQAEISQPKSSDTIQKKNTSSERYHPKLVTLKNMQSVTTVSPLLSPSVTMSPYVSPTTVTMSPLLSPSQSSVPVVPTFSPSPSMTPTMTVTPVSNPHVVINEIAWMGTTASSNDEWIELYNDGDINVDLNGWTLQAQDSIPKVTLSGVIGPRSFYLLERTNSTTTDVQENTVYTGSLENNGEILELLDASGNIRDTVDAWYAGDNTSKSSMERVSSSVPGNNPQNWATNDGMIRNGHDADGAPINGTPGAINSKSH